MKSKELRRQIGEKVRKLRKERHLSQERLAEFANLHPTYISNIENGKVNASVFSFYQIAEALNVPLTELMVVVAGQADRKHDAEISDLFGRVRNLDKKAKLLFISAARGLFSGIEQIRQ